MWKTLKNLLSEIKDCHRYIKARGDKYDDVMNKESDGSEFDAGVISSNTRFIQRILPDLSEELRDYMQFIWLKERAEALTNIRVVGMPDGFKSALQALEMIETCSPEDTVIWWQGYLAGYNNASVRSDSILKVQINKVSSKL